MHPGRGRDQRWRQVHGVSDLKDHGHEEIRRWLYDRPRNRVKHAVSLVVMGLRPSPPGGDLNRGPIGTPGKCSVHILPYIACQSVSALVKCRLHLD